MRVLDTASRVFWRPQILLLLGVSVIGGHFAFAALDAARGFWNLPRASMVALALVVIAQSWVGLCISATALAITRSEGAARSIVWVPATTAFEAGLVSIALAVPTLASLVFLIVPGVILALRWSLVPMLIVDGRSAWLASAEESAMLTYGRRLDLLLLWSLVAAVFLLVAGVQAVASPALAWPLQVVASAFALTILAAAYGHLTDFY